MGKIIGTAAKPNKICYRASKDYRIEAQTGDVTNAGTDSNIYVAIYGDKETTKEIRLYGEGMHQHNRFFRFIKQL